jgi:hypothetical protein
VHCAEEERAHPSLLLSAPTSAQLRSSQDLLKMENALLDLIDVLLVVAIGFGIIMIALPPAFGLGLTKQSGGSLGPDNDL